MRVAVISDIHGNKSALEAVLRDIEMQNVDQIICAGDFIDPLPESREVWQMLKARSIPMIRGNHEDYVIAVFKDGSSPQSSDENWKPVRSTAKLFSESDIDEIQSYPISIYIKELDALICHGSPSSNSKNWRAGVDELMARDLEKESAKLIACGHSHMIRKENWRDKILVMIGSVGVPLHSRPSAEYTILSKNGDEYTVENQFVPYDNVATVRKFVDSGFVKAGFPMSLLLMDEVLTAERKISPFVAWKH